MQINTAVQVREVWLQVQPKSTGTITLKGDCANFASQILHEEESSEKPTHGTTTIRGTRAWVNADGFRAICFTAAGLH